MGHRESLHWLGFDDYNDALARLFMHLPGFTSASCYLHKLPVIRSWEVCGLQLDIMVRNHVCGMGFRSWDSVRFVLCEHSGLHEEREQLVPHPLVLRGGKLSQQGVDRRIHRIKHCLLQLCSLRLARLLRGRPSWTIRAGYPWVPLQHGHPSSRSMERQRLRVQVPGPDTSREHAFW